MANALNTSVWHTLMPTLPQYGANRFIRNEVRTEKTTLIVWRCKECGESKIVSHFDRSLEKWERDHKCLTKAKAS